MDKRKKTLTFITGGALLLIIFAVFFSGSDSDDKKPQTGISQGGFIIQPKVKKDDSWFGGFFQKIFGSGDSLSDLEKGADDPKYVELVGRIDRLYSDFGMLPKEKQDEKKLLTDQASLVIDYQLGKDHPSKKEFLNIVGWSHDARQPITKKYTEGKMDRVELFKELNAHFNEVSNRYASILTDEEYRSMFNMEKGDNLAETMGLTPEMAKALDEQEKKTPFSGGLSSEGYNMTEDENMTKEQTEKFQKTYGDPPGYISQPKETRPE